jgi:fructose-1,6-bisphosphatase II
VTQAEAEDAATLEPEAERAPCQCQSYLRGTEVAALAAARWLGRADQEGAEEAAAAGMRKTLDRLPIRGRVVFGSVGDEGGLTPGALIGAGEAEVDLALDPLEGRGVVARGGNGAMSMIAVGEPGRLLTLHHDLIEEIRNAGARIKLIQDGDVTASISAAIRGTNDHLAIGIGGTRQAVLSAAALRCLGGELQAQFWPTSRSEIDQLREVGIEDYTRIYTTEDLAPGEMIVAATGVSNGDLLRGVRFLADSARTHSLLMCTRCNWVRFVDGIHFFARERREEVRLLGF